MAGRIRTIKPELLEDERVAALSSNAFRLFVGCILLADDYGNLRLAIGLLAGSVFWQLLEENRIGMPEIEAARAELLATGAVDPTTKLPRPGLLTPYRVRGQLYAHVSGWERHQRVDHPGPARVPGMSDPECEKLSFNFNGMREIREPLASDSSRSRERLAPDLDRDHDHDPDLDPIDPASAGSEPDGSGFSLAPGQGSPKLTDEVSPAQPPPKDRPTPPPSLTATDASPGIGTVPDASQVALASQAGQDRAADGHASDASRSPSVAKAKGVLEVFEVYVEGWRKAIGGTRPPKLDEKRRKMIAMRLREFSVDDLKLACQGIWRSEFNLREGHYGIDLVLRDAAHIERFRAIALDETASPAHRAGVTADVVLELWSSLYLKSVRKYGAYTPQLNDRASAARYAEHAFEQAKERATKQGAPEQVAALAKALLAHWFKQYLREDGERYAWRDAKHPFRWVDRAIPTAGTPWAKERKPAAQVSAPAPEPIRAPPSASVRGLIAGALDKMGAPTSAERAPEGRS